MIRIIIILAGWTLSFGAFAQSEIPFEISNEGWELKGDLRLPDGKPKGIVLMFHKAAGNRGEYKSIATRLEVEGFASLRVDLRGNGESTNLDEFDPVVRKNTEVNQGAFRDIAIIHNWVKRDPRFEGIPIVNISGSYSGEMAARAMDITGPADAYIQLSPGSISDESMRNAGASGVPWLFVRAENERSFFVDIFEGVKDLAPSAERWVIPGVGREGHATRMFNGRPEFEVRLVNWIKEKTK